MRESRAFGCLKNAMKSDAQATLVETTEVGNANPSATGILPRDGEMAALIRGHDWGSTPLGDTTQWPASLHTAVRFVLANRFPMLLCWGPQYISIYNDA